MKNTVNHGGEFVAIGILMMAWSIALIVLLISELNFMLFLVIMIVLVGGLSILIIGTKIINHEKMILARLESGKSILARWQYKGEVLQQRRDQIISLEKPEARNILIGLFAIMMGCIFAYSIPTTYLLIALLPLGLGLIILLEAIIKTEIRKRAVRQCKGEVLITYYGVYHLGCLADWNHMTTFFIRAWVEQIYHQYWLVLLYQTKEGRFTRHEQLRILVPDGLDESAEEVSAKLNGQYFKKRTTSLKKQPPAHTARSD